MDCSMPGFPVHHQLPKLTQIMSIELVMPSNHPTLCRPLLLLPPIFPSIRVFSNASVLRIRWPNTAASASASVLPMNIQDWFPLGLTGLISLQYKGLSRIFSQHHSSKAWMKRKWRFLIFIKFLNWKNDENIKWFDPWVEIPCRKAWQPIPVFLPGESHGQRSLVGHSPWGCRVGCD